MKVGDCLEILAALFGFAALWMGLYLPAALAGACVFLFYEAQCFGTQPLPKFHKPRLSGQWHDRLYGKGTQ